MHLHIFIRGCCVTVVRALQGAEEESRHSAFAVSNNITQEVGDVTPSTVAHVPQSGDFVMVQEKVMFHMLPCVTVSATMLP